MKYVPFVAFAVLTAPPTFGAAAELSKSEQVRIAVQGICPVSEQQLGQHGQPTKAKIGGEVVYLCCQGCLSGKVDKKHWATIHANLAKAQGKCPVMNKKLPENPKSTIADGRVVYLCCPLCAQKVQGDSGKYLAVVDRFYAEHLNAVEAETP
jgi:hypothetical protein